jgi:cytochrome o ubiquinol oxidase subunit II
LNTLLALGRLETSLAQAVSSQHASRYRRLLLAASTLGLAGCSQGVLDPHGPVGSAEKTILINSLAIMLAIVIPTIVLTLVVAWWFRASNTRARYRPELDFSGKIEMIVWSIPAMVVLLLGGLAWVGSHDLDPTRPLPTQGKPVEVEVVALDWKWLFIYPGSDIASVNRLVVPAGVPVHFRLTSASVMNSFFVPQLGTQIYAMPRMTTQLNLLAASVGQFPGLSAQFSGDGFSRMRFVVDSVPPAAFAQWSANHAGTALDAKSYASLAQPSTLSQPTFYGQVAPGLFESIAHDGAPKAAAVSSITLTQSRASALQGG